MIVNVFAVLASAPFLFSDPALPKRADSPAPTPTIGLIELDDTPVERPHPLAWLMGTDGSPTLRDVVGLLQQAENDTAMNGVVVRVRDAQFSVTQVEEIGRAMARVRAKGKKVHLFADSYSTPELLLGSYADEVILQSGGDVSLPGMHMEEMFMADTLAWAGITPDFVQIGDYKGASESMARNAPSPQWEQNISGLLDAMYGSVRGQLKAGRKMSDSELDEAMRQAFLADGETAMRVRLIDAAIDLPTISEHLATAYGAEVAWTNIEAPEPENAIRMSASDPLSAIAEIFREPDRTLDRETIAVLHIDGPIVDGESSAGGFFGEQAVGSVTVRRALDEIEGEDLIKGVIVRVNSPGGSATASEVMWQGLKRLSAKKPVWVSVGSMAASGGYYVSMGGTKIYVNPSSIVGSIGVVGGKLAMAGLYDKLKVRVVERSRGPLGGMMSGTRPWTEAQRGLVRTRMTQTYDLFASRVTAARPGIDMSKAAEGRLFAGADAVALKMADKIGGLEDCIVDLAVAVKLEPGEYDVVEYPGAMSVGEMLDESFGGGASASMTVRDLMRPRGGEAAATVLREVVGERAWPGVRDSLGALMQMREEPVLLVSPRVVIVR